ncbi:MULTISPECIES: hypothetical protein [unclassified Streptomyces]|uniref:hypothetical protein n=1 Tax=unclassified Streptomyces TaxID=2593676 RepID=UPI0033B73C5F
MLTYEPHRDRHRELIREADAERLARAARKARRTPRRRSGGHGPEGRVSTGGGGERDRFAPAA